MTTQRLFTHLLAIFVITVWGVTFVSTKLLLEAGFNPASILFYRFALAYIGIWLAAYRLPLFAQSLKDELCFVLMGVFGGSMYFFTENLALGYTLTNNVSLIVCMNPLLIAIIAHFLSKEDKLSPRLLLGSLLALAGVTLVIFNGNFTFEITIVGELLAFAAAFSWAFGQIPRSFSHSQGDALWYAHGLTYFPIPPADYQFYPLYPTCGMGQFCLLRAGSHAFMLFSME